MINFTDMAIMLWTHTDKKIGEFSSVGNTTGIRG
jgi:hypothetical protein